MNSHFLPMNEEAGCNYPQAMYSLLQKLGCILIELDTDLNIREFNREAAVLYQCDKKMALNKNFLELCQHLNISLPIADFSAVLAGQTIDKITQVLTMGMVKKHIQWTVLPLFHLADNKRVASILLIGLDLKSHEQKPVPLNYHEYVINNVPHSIFWKNIHSVFMGCNDRFAALAGLKSADDIIGKRDHDLPWTKDESDAYIEDDKRVIESGVSKLNIEETQTVNGKKITLLTSKVPLYDNDGHPSGVLGIFTDITERKQMEDDLRKSKEAAEAANKAKILFLANMSHDIKTPISGIVSTAEVLIRLIDEVEYKNFIEDIKASGLRLLDFMTEIIEISKIETKKNAEPDSRFKLKQLIDDMVLLMKPAIVSKPYALEVQYDNNIPVYLVGNYAHLYRIILNLISNAIKFTKQGKVCIDIRQLKETDIESFVQIRVEDTGMGIPEDKLSVIFDQFSRLTPASEGVYKGAGLGLSIVKEFVEAMQGKVYVESEEGKGSRFTCIVPLKKTAFADENESIEAHETKVTNADEGNLHRGAKILLVEDDAIGAKAVQWILQSLGCVVDVAKTGNQALDLYQKNQYHLIYLDIGLPDISGIEVVLQIRKIEHHLKKYTPIVALSAHVNDEIKMDCFKAGTDDVLGKPLIRDDAIRMIQKNIRLAKSFSR